MSPWAQKLSPRTRHMLAGGALGALGLVAIYEIFRARSAIAAPLALPPDVRVSPVKKHEHRHKHKHHGHERGHYGHQHKEHDRG